MSISRAVSIDPNYANRQGYDPLFLGIPVPLPTLSPEQSGQAIMPPLPYHHFSVVMHAHRRLAIYTAVNINGAQAKRLRREPDRWSYDPRLPAESQLDAAFYQGNALDLGHLVRRLDPTWGTLAKAANDDTFHLTNAAPQHASFNRTKPLWAGLEDYLLKNTELNALKLSVFTGPVLREDDPIFNSVQLPRAFWKVAVMHTAGGMLLSTAYLLDQSELLTHLAQRDFELGAFRTFQLPVREVEQRSHLLFGELDTRDPLRNHRALGMIELTSLKQIVHQ